MPQQSGATSTGNWLAVHTNLTRSTAFRTARFDAVELEEEERDAQAAMRLTMYDDGHGKVHGRFVLDAFTGAALRKMVLAIAAPKHQAASGPLGERKPTAERMGRAFGELINKLLEAGGCQVDGCDAPPGLTHLHHKIEWSQGGRTDLDNTIMICAPHHARAHDPTYQLTPIPGDKFTFHRRT